jgi:hypothetical protein
LGRTGKSGHTGAKEETRPVKRKEYKGSREGRNTCKTLKKKDWKRKINRSRERRNEKRKGLVWNW